MRVHLHKLDRQFARFCTEGDAEALGYVFDRTAPELLHVAAWLTRNRADADDLVQRTFLTAIEQRQRFAQERRVRPWLLAILTNHARNLRRERQPRAAPQVTRPTDDPLQAAVDAEFMDWLRAAGAAIGSPYREVLALHLEAGLDAREIAQRLDRPAGSVRTQLMRGLTRLRRRVPRSFVTGALAWRCERPSLAAVRVNVLAAARAAAPPPGEMAAAATGVTSVRKAAGLATALLSVALAVAVVRRWQEALFARQRREGRGPRRPTARGGRHRRDRDLRCRGPFLPPRRGFARRGVGSLAPAGRLTRTRRRDRPAAARADGERTRARPR